ncbi:MAG: sulfatase [Akkermansiaceae bacterium]|nr:sulfatase [Akkermansiaceae bacterium]
MKFALRIMVLAATLIAFYVKPATAAPSARNVLFIIADDLNTFLGCYGDPRAKTPNIDRLAARGVRFDRAYCSQPLCGPSRNSILTGLYPNSTGILANAQIFRQSIPNQISLPQAFRNQGWFAARVGKLYHYDVPKSIGTAGHDDPASWEVQMNPAGVDHLEEENKIVSLSPGNFGATLSWYASPRTDADHTDGKVASEAEWILERCAKQQDRPFFLAVGFFRPHTPFVAPKSPYFDEYAEADMPIVAGVKEDQADLPPAALASRKAEEEKMTDTQRRRAMQGYYASISFMDAQVGRVIETLDRLNLTDNTVIVFTSDHGYHMGEHGLWQKRSLFEESTRVPLLIVAPGVIPQAAVAKSPISQVDLYPTLAGLCGIKAPSNLQGQNLIKMFTDPSEVGRGWAVTQGTHGYSLRTTRWRYTEWDEGKQGRELYDHDADPKELRNLARDPALEQVVKALSEQLRSAVKTTFPPSGKTPEIKEGLWTPSF